MTDCSTHCQHTQIYYINYSGNCNHGANSQQLNTRSEQHTAQSLLTTYGTSTVTQAVANNAVEHLGRELITLINSLDIPAFMKNDARSVINQLIQPSVSSVPAGAQEGVNQTLKGGGSDQSADDIMSGIMKLIQSAMREATEEASGNSSRRSGGKGNWLAILARALGDTAGKHLKQMVELGEKMGGIDSKENPEQFAKIQAEFQAEAQIFKMFQEAIGTMVKSIGEGMASVARKQ